MGVIELNEGTTALTNIANAIRAKNGKTTKYKPSEMAAAIRSLTLKPLYPFATATDAQLTEMVNAYYNGIITLDDVKSVWSVGDKRKISLSAMAATGVGESHVAQDQYFTILDFDHDDLVENKNDKTKALITVQQEKLLSNGTSCEYGFMNNTATNYGGWENTLRRTWCNDTYYNALPNEIRTLINQTTHINYINSAGDISVSSDYCFLPSVTEVLGYQGLSAGDEEGIHYAYFKDSNNINVIKYIGDADTYTSGTYNWYLRSRDTSRGDIAFCNITTSGSNSSNSAEGRQGLAPCFSM